MSTRGTYIVFFLKNDPQDRGGCGLPLMPLLQRIRTDGARQRAAQSPQRAAADLMAQQTPARGARQRRPEALGAARRTVVVVLVLARARAVAGAGRRARGAVLVTAAVGARAGVVVVGRVGDGWDGVGRVVAGLCELQLGLG